MTDIHCHILPDFDDGAADLAESLIMAQMAVTSGVSGIVVTPHFRGERESLALLPLLVERYEELIGAVRQENLSLRIYPGAEILCLPETVELAREGQLPTIANTDYLLVEFYFNASLGFLEETLDALAACGYRPVVAHPERYEAVQHAPRVLESWFRKGYVLQLNKGSVLGAFGPRVRETAHWMLQRGLAHLVASDAHGIHRRTTDMTLLRQTIAELCPQQYAQILLIQNPRRLVRGEDMVPAK